MAKRLISIILCFVLCSASTISAFADDEENSSSVPDSSGAELEVISNYESIKADTLQSVQELSENIYTYDTNVKSLTSSTSSTTYTTSDIYNLLVDNFIYPSANSNSYFALSYNCFNSINSKCNTWNSYFSNINSKINTISSNLSTVKSTLSNIDTSLGGDSAITLYSLLQDDLEILINAFGGDNPATSIWSLLSSISSNVSVLASDDTNILNALSNLNSKLDTIISSVGLIDDFRDDYNNLTWFNPNFTYYGFTTDLTNYIDSSIGQNTDGYFVFKYTNTISNPSIYKFYLPIWSSITPFRNNYVDDIDLYFDYNGSMFHLDGNYSIEYSYSTPSLTVYFTDCAIPRNTNIYLYVDFSDNCTMYIRPATYDYSLMYVDNSKLDYYYIYDMLKSKQSSLALDRLSDIYASDDIVSAKEEQQDYEDTVIDDFTGNGSASASISDISNIKGTSNALKTGLSTGVDYSYAFSSIDDDSGLYVWFSQDVADFFTVSYPTTNTRNALKSSNDFDKIVWSDNIPNVLDKYNSDVDEVINSGKSYK